MSGIQSVSISISITESDTNSSSGSGASSQTQRNPFLNPNGPFANLDLTPQQQQQIAQIFSQNASGQNSGGQSSNGQSGNGQSWSQIISQINAILSPQQQTTLQGDLQSLASHHHHGSGSSSQSNPLAQLDLTSAQQTQIGQIIQSAQTNGTSPSDELTQIDDVLTPTQQQQLISLISSDSSAGSSASTSSASGNVISTTA